MWALGIPTLAIVLGKFFTFPVVVIVTVVVIGLTILNVIATKQDLKAAGLDDLPKAEVRNMWILRIYAYCGVLLMWGIFLDRPDAAFARVFLHEHVVRHIIAE